MSRELDAQVHEAVFGQQTEVRGCFYFQDDGCWSEWQSADENPYAEEPRSRLPLTPHPCYGNELDGWNVVPFYSTSMRDAWKVFAKMGEQMLACHIMLENCAGIRYDCKMYDDRSGGDYKKGIWVHSCEDTAPLAICHTALKAKEREKALPRTAD